VGSHGPGPRQPEALHVQVEQSALFPEAMFTRGRIMLLAPARLGGLRGRRLAGPGRGDWSGLPGAARDGSGVDGGEQAGDAAADRVWGPSGSES
jgi:hypothetical protein